MTPFVIDEKTQILDALPILLEAWTERTGARLKIEKGRVAFEIDVDVLKLIDAIQFKHKSAILLSGVSE